MSLTAPSLFTWQIKLKNEKKSFRLQFWELGLDEITPTIVARFRSFQDRNRKIDLQNQKNHCILFEIVAYSFYIGLKL